MPEIHKGESLKSLFLVKDFGQFLSNKRNKGEFMDAESAYSILLKSLSKEDLNSLMELNVKFGMIVSPASQIQLPKCVKAINLICFEKHKLDKFNKHEVVAIILHEIGHVFNPNVNGDEYEFKADDYAIDRGFKNYIASSLQFGIKKNIEGFNQEINERRINRIKNL